MRPFIPRKKKVHAPEITGTMKYVRIDGRTQIMVNANIPDDQARTSYFERLNRSLHGSDIARIANTPNMPVKEEFREPDEVIDEIEAIIEDETEIIE